MNAARPGVIACTDPLAELLGARRPGEPFEYAYADVVKLSGHSCPTVASAFLATAAALEALYPGALPVRGQIEVVLGGAEDDAALGPMSQVIALITGAAGPTGFGGLMGRHRRRDLLRFDPSLEGRIRFRRTDTGDAVELTCTPSRVPSPPELGGLLSAALSGRGTPAERGRFAELWQQRVTEMLGGDRDRVVQLRRL